MRESEIKRSIIIEYLSRRASYLKSPAPNPKLSIAIWFRQHPEEVDSFFQFILKEFKLHEQQVEKELLFSFTPEQLVFYLDNLSA
jgi:hypothetical protein